MADLWHFQRVSIVYTGHSKRSQTKEKEKKRKREKEREEVAMEACISQLCVRARVYVTGRDRREKARDDDARFNQQFVLILVGAVSPLGLCSPLFLPSFPSAHGYFYLAHSYRYVLGSPSLSMFFFALRAPPDLFPVSLTLILWPWSFFSSRNFKRSHQIVYVHSQQQQQNVAHY